MQQKQLGQFYTDKNIFKSPAFIKWFNAIPEKDKQIVLEPFAGSNGIIHMLDKLGFVKSFVSYDIMPRHPDVVYKDTLTDFPQNYSLIVTNPPFLARNSASRRNLQVEFDQCNDLYELCLKKCLENSQYVAAIIPESFITNQLIDKSRLYAVISLAEKNIFKDTEHPVCLALFNPEAKQDYDIYINDDFVGSYNTLKEKEDKFLSEFLECENSIQVDSSEYKIMWHNPEGQLGIEVIDATEKKKKMHFLEGAYIKSEEVNYQTRLRTRILILDKNNKPVKKLIIKKIIKKANVVLSEYRKETHDVFLTAFKGLRNDGYYRRRLDFTKARLILKNSLKNL